MSVSIFAENSRCCSSRVTALDTVALDSASSVAADANDRNSTTFAKIASASTGGSPYPSASLRKMSADERAQADAMMAADRDFAALVEAWEADRWGNLVYRGSGGNFNPIVARAAELTLAQAQHIRELGELHPHTIGTPGVYVNRVVQVDRGGDWLKPEQA